MVPRSFQLADVESRFGTLDAKGFRWKINVPCLHLRLVSAHCGNPPLHFRVHKSLCWFANLAFSKIETLVHTTIKHFSLFNAVNRGALVVPKTMGGECARLRVGEDALGHSSAH
eukprot:1178270-Prorocentrum_minimum.AAC.4